MFSRVQLRLLAGDQGVNWQPLFEYLRAHGQRAWADWLEAQSPDWLRRHGDYGRWSAALEALPEIDRVEADFDSPAVTLRGRCVEEEALHGALQGLIPWRKGPFQIAGVHVDSEWRSDLKWNRVLPELGSLERRRVLDVGCGNGYYAWRMLAQNPEFVLGIEPSVLFNLQFLALQKYLQRPDIALLPLGVEDMPADLEWFDTVFSMGVLYHRKSPIDHLYQLKSFLKSGGELCLETLVIEGGRGQLLLPQGRYARMRNVWFIPSSAELLVWLERCGFTDARVAYEAPTDVEEQRSTDWMRFESLAECLQPENPRLTVEGLPAPRRAVLIAHKP